MESNDDPDVIILSPPVPKIQKPTARKTFPNSVPYRKHINIIKTLSKKKMVNNLKGNKKKMSVESGALTNQQSSQKHKVPSLNIQQLGVPSSSANEVRISNTMSVKFQPMNVNIVVNDQQTSVPSSRTTPPPPPPVIPINLVMLDDSRNNTDNDAYGGNVRSVSQQEQDLFPQLQAKLLSSGTSVRGSEIEPTINQINSMSQKLMKQATSMVEGMLRDMSAEGQTTATVKLLQLEIERIQRDHRLELAKLKHNANMLVTDMGKRIEKIEAKYQCIVTDIKLKCKAEKEHITTDMKLKFEVEKETAVNEAKTKQWCTFCKKEAFLYCCWNTAYCGYPCQKADWPKHMPNCRNRYQAQLMAAQRQR